MPVSSCISRQAKKAIALSAVTNAAGNAFFNLLPAGFTIAPVCAISCESANANLVDARVTNRTIGNVTVNVQQALGVSVLGLTVLAAKTAAAGVTVHLYAVEA